MKLPILALAAGLLATACMYPPEKPEAPPEAPEAPAPTETVGERVQPEIRYYEIADT